MYLDGKIFITCIHKHYFIFRIKMQFELTHVNTTEDGFFNCVAKCQTARQTGRTEDLITPFISRHSILPLRVVTTECETTEP